MDIQYLNHSSFLIKTKYEGNKLIKIITDPFSDKIGIKFKSTEADIVLVSHDHNDHNNVDGIKGLTTKDMQDESFESHLNKPFVINTPGEFEVKGVHIKGITSYHDNKKGEVRGKNIIYTIYNEGFRVCFLGDLGHQLSDKQIEQIGDIDLLMVPVGNVFTIDPETASEVINQIEPSYVIPMHYKTENHTDSYFDGLKPLKSFLDAMGSEDIKPKESFTLTKSVEEETEVVILNPQYT